MATTVKDNCFNCAYYLEEETGEDVCMCPESPFVGKERDSANLCDYYFAHRKFKKDWDTFLNFLNGLYVKKAIELVNLLKETCLNCQHCNKGFFTDQGICVCKESPSWQRMRMGRDITPCKFFEAVNVRKE